MARGSITNNYYDAASGTNDWYGSDGAKSIYVPKKFSLDVLAQFYNESTAIQLCNTDYQGDIKSAGDSVVIRKDPTVTTSAYSIGGTITYEVPDEDAITMYIDQYRSNSFRIDTIDDLETDLNLPSRFQEACKESMKQVIDEEIFNYMVGGVSNGGAIGTAIADASSTLIASTNWGQTAGAKSASFDLGDDTAGGADAIAITKDNIQTMLVNLNAVLAEAKTYGDWFCMTPAVAAFLKLSDLKQANTSGDSTAVLRSGLIGVVDGSKVYVTNNMPTLSTDTLETIIAGNSQFCSFASQITDSEVLPIPDSFGKYYRSLSVYGRRVVQPTAAALAIVTV